MILKIRSYIDKMTKIESEINIPNYSNWLEYRAFLKDVSTLQVISFLDTTFCIDEYRFIDKGFHAL